ncbi:MAG: DUF424 domain-containing protein [Methanomicrobiales archaeon]|nr:DUF424 domain-containing protein [Methanomicrobiales archaeon]
MFMKIHRSPDCPEVVAVCDRELINTTHRTETMTVAISAGFYGTTEVTEAQVQEALKNAGNINLMGERAVSVAVAMGLIDRKSCIMIGTIPHAQVYQL